MLSIWSLFSGIGGLERGLEQAGLGRTVLQCEIEDYPRKILAKHWPDVMRFRDVRDISWETFDETGTYLPCDLICGGFPCQPVSLAGKGKAQEDERWLWPEFERIIGEFKPTWVVAENVPGLRKRGLIDVLGGLAALGYDAEWIRLSAAAVGAPHLRERLFIVAYNPDGVTQNNREREQTSGVETNPNANTSGRIAVKEPDSRTQGRRQAQSRPDSDRVVQDVAAQPWIFTPERRKEIPINPYVTNWRAEPDVGRVAYGVPDRVDRLKALGNAVVPQCAEFVGRCIKEAIDDNGH